MGIFSAIFCKNRQKEKRDDSQSVTVKDDLVQTSTSDDDRKSLLTSANKKEPSPFLIDEEIEQKVNK